MSSHVSTLLKCAASFNAKPSPTMGLGNIGTAVTNRQCLKNMLRTDPASTVILKAYLTTGEWSDTGGSLVPEDLGSFLVPTGNGYTQGTPLPSGPSTLAFDAPSGVITITFPTVSWTISGGNVGPARGMFIAGPRDITLSTPGAANIYFWIDFGRNITQEPDSTLSIVPQLIVG